MSTNTDGTQVPPWARRECMSDEQVEFLDDLRKIQPSKSLELARRLPPSKAIYPNLLLEATQEFMEKGGQLEGPFDYGNFNMVGDLRRLRRRLMNEEVREYIEKGEGRNDPVETLDGLLDIIVIAYGTALAYFGPEVVRQASVEVARSNLDKVDGPGLPIYREDGKIMKPEGWQGPNIAGALENWEDR